MTKYTKTLLKQNEALLEQKADLHRVMKKLTDALNASSAEVVRLRDALERVSETSKDRKVMADALVAQLRRYTS